MASQPQAFVNLEEAMSDVRDQGQRGSCSSFAALGLLESYIDKSANYSEQCLAYHSSQEDAAMTELRLKYIITNGAYNENDCPYVDPQGFEEWLLADKDKRKELQLVARNQIPDLSATKKIYPSFSSIEKRVDGLTDAQFIAYIQNQLRNNSPLAVSTIVVGWDEWRSGLISSVPSEEEIKKSCENSLNPTIKKCRSHAVVLTGYDDSRQLIFFKNSWGKNWGLDQKYAKTTILSDRTGYGAISYTYLAKFRVNNLITLS